MNGPIAVITRNSRAPFLRPAKQQSGSSVEQTDMAWHNHRSLCLLQLSKARLMRQQWGPPQAAAAETRH